MPFESISRRRAMTSMMAASGLAAAPSLARAMDVGALGEPLGVQALAIRKYIVSDFDGTLAVLKAMGYGQVELTSFPGFVGNFRGDFGPLAQMPAAEVGAKIRRSGLECRSCHFLDNEFLPANWNKTLDWARGVGVGTMVYAGGELPHHDPSADDMKRYFDTLNETGARVRAAGMRMAVHTDAGYWRPVSGGPTVADHFVKAVDPENCRIQFDFGSVVQASADGPALIERYAGHLDSIHLRDGKTPEDPDAYLPALPLGEGEVDWKAVMTAGRRAGVTRYIVEMQLRPLFGMLDGMRDSMDYLKALQV